MTPSARIQAVIEILQGLDESRLPADRFIRDFFRKRRYAGSKDRAAITERVYDIFRHRASLSWRMNSEAPRALAIASLASGHTGSEEIEAIFSGERYAPASLTEGERTVLHAPRPEAMPAPVKGEFPAFLEAGLKRAFGDNLLEEMTAMLARASIDLRVNLLKTSRDAALAALEAEGFDASPGPYAPTAIRIESGSGAARLGDGKLFQGGGFEFQDEAAQIACILAAAEPGMRVLDLAAGAGGKSLALAALMHDRGEILAYDIAPQRLAQIAARAERAGAHIIRTITELPRSDSKRGFDRIFVDAPCSGSGTWRRQPENKWRLSPQRLDELNRIQDSLLDVAALRVHAQARILYATCSILPCENEDRVRAFLARHPEFMVIPARTAWDESAYGGSPPGLGEFFRATPLRTGTDGFFAAILERKA